MTRPTLTALILFATLCATAHGQVILTEIMYNPDSPESRTLPRDQPDADAEPVRTEWVEIHNTGTEPVDVSGWHLADEDGRTGPLPKATVLAPGQTVVLIPADCTVDDFRAAWGEGFEIYPVTGWGPGGLNNLSNNPSDTSEMLELRGAEDQIIDQVNFDDDEGWPADQPDGPSIYLLPGAMNREANDVAANWARSQVAVHGGRLNRKTEVFPGQDIGSPGTVPASDTEPEPVPLPDQTH